MDETWLALAVLVALGCAVIVAAGLIGWFALHGALATLRRKVERLERELAVLRSRAPSDLQPTPHTVAPTAPSPVPEPAVAPSQPGLGLVEPPVEAPPAPVETLRAAAEPEAAPLPELPPSPPASRPAPARIDWERWMGVRGAALLGGAILALAGILFVQYSIQRGWLGPAERCALGFVAGLACVAVSWPLRSRAYLVTSDALTGAGVTLLFAATWSARVRHELIPFWLALLVMAGATALCGWLAARRESRTIAVFGLIGGFATPLLLSLGSSRPLALFGYLLLLNLGVLALSRARRWPVLATLGSIATPLVFAFWIVRHFSPDELPLALLFCGASALLFSLSAGEGRGRAAPIIGSLAPFVFALYFAGSVQTTPHLLPVALLLAVLVVGASVAALRVRAPGILFVAALGSSGSVAVWTASARLTDALGWELAAIVVGLALLAHLALEWAARREPESRARIADGASACALGLAVSIVIAVFAAPYVRPWPWLAAALALGALAMRQSALGGRAFLTGAAALGASGVFVLWNEQRPLDASLRPALEALVVAGLGALALVPLALTRQGARRTWSWAGALAASSLLSLAWITSERHSAVEVWTPLMASASALALCGLVAARDQRRTIGFALIAFWAWASACDLAWSPDAGQAGRLLAWCAASAALFAGLPLLDRGGFGSVRGVWRVAALATALWAEPSFKAWTELRPSAPAWQFFALPIVLAGAVALALLRERRSLDDAGARSSRATGFAWFAPLALSCAALAFVARVERAEFGVGMALCALGFALVSRASAHGGLRLAALPLAALAFLGGASDLLAAAERSPDFQRTGWPLVHWLSFAFAAPAAALFSCAWLLRGDEAERAARARDFPRLPALAQAPAWLALGGILWSFAWVNVEVVNLCSDGPGYALTMARMPVRDVALSVAWTAFSLALLVLGVRLDRGALRWTSLVFFLGTIAKVFLYDLGEVRGLFRVASLVGLALALLSVSLLYQRFVFRVRARDQA